MCEISRHVREAPTSADRWLRRVLLVCVSALTLAPGSGSAQSCTVSSAGVAFGSYNPLGANGTAPLDAASTINFLCNRRLAVVVTLSAGQYGTFAMRQMARSGMTGDRLRYNLYLDAPRTVIWGDRSLGAGHYYTGTARRNRTISVPLYGRVPAGQDAAAGSYTDQVVITIEY
jgi:spore coat protein U-like protein